MKRRPIPQHLFRKSDLGETLVRINRWPKLAKSLEGKKVRIWSGEHCSYWRPDGAGYTYEIAAAGIYKFEEAFRKTSGCGPEKQIMYRVVTDNIVTIDQSIKDILHMPGMTPETELLLRLAIEAQRDGKMPDISLLK